MGDFLRWSVTGKTRAQREAEAAEEEARKVRELAAIGMPSPHADDPTEISRRQEAPEGTPKLRAGITSADPESGAALIEDLSKLEELKRVPTHQLTPEEHETIRTKTGPTMLRALPAAIDPLGEAGYRAAKALGASEPVALAADVATGLGIGSLASLPTTVEALPRPAEPEGTGSRPTPPGRPASATTS
jgi:hypothetical protein